MWYLHVNFALIIQNIIISASIILLLFHEKVFWLLTRKVLSKVEIELIEGQEEVSHGVHDNRIDAIMITKDTKKNTSDDIRNSNCRINHSGLGLVTKASINYVAVQVNPENSHRGKEQNIVDAEQGERYILENSE